MNSLNKSNLKSLNNNPSQLQNSRQGQQDDFEYQDDEQYEEEFDELEKSEQKVNVKQLGNKDSIINATSLNGKVDTGIKKMQENVENRILSRQKGNNNQPPSKENNWNQNKKVATQIQHQQYPQSNHKLAHDLNSPNNIKQNTQQNQENFQDIKMENDDQESESEQQQEEESLVVQNQQPQQQSYTLLSSKQNNTQQKNISQKVKTQQNQHQKYKPSPKPLLSRQQLSHTIYQNQKTIKQLKQKTATYRQQIKNISNLVDKDLQKSIVKITNNNKHSINIKQVFSELNQLNKNNQTPTINKLRQQLHNIRNQSKLMKIQIVSIQDKINDPITHENIIKCQELQNKLKQLSLQLNKKKQQKTFATQQLQRMKLSSGLVQFQHFQKSIHKNQQTLSKLLSQIKQQRAKIYKLQKHDINLMEKLKYLIQNNQKLQYNLAQSQKLIEDKMTPDQLKKNIHSLLNDINSIFQQRNIVENDKFKLIKTLTTQIQSFENKNLLILNQVRKLDASLLQLYTQKAPKKHSLNKPPPKTAQKLHQTIDSGSPILRQKYNQTTQEMPNDKNHNDKNISIPTTSSMNRFRSKVQVKMSSVNQKEKEKEKISAFVDTQDLKQQNHKHQPHQVQQTHKNEQKQKITEPEEIFTQSKTILSFGDLKVDQKGAILSDQILGKVKIRQIHLFVDKKNFYGVHCKYFNHEKPQIFGMKICEKNADQKCEKISLVLNVQQKQHISNIKVGYSLKNEIKLIEITTSLQNLVNWNVQNEVSRTQTKSIQKYSSICIKAKLISTEDIPSTSKSLNELMIDRPKLKLAGLGFSVVELIKSSTK